MKLTDLVYRSWYYFRLGYGTYLAFVVGIFGTLITVYYLAIRSAPDLLFLFPHFWIFAVVGLVIGLPVSVLIGWAHIKRSALWSTEVDIGVEANPYYYKLTPGFQKDVYAPLYLEVLRLVRRLSERDRLLTEEEKARIIEIEKHMEVLIAGGYVGQPRRKL